MILKYFVNWTKCVKKYANNVAYYFKNPLESDIWWDCDIYGDTFLIKISRKPLMLNVTENMLFSLNKSSTHRLPLQNSIRVQVIFLEKFARKILVIRVERFLALADSC